MVNNQSVTEKKVLVVDDEPEIRRILEKKLKRFNANIYSSPDGRDAIFKLENQKFDLILIDLKMPKKDGFKVIEEIRHMDTPGLGKKQPNLNTPIVVISGHLNEESIKKLAPNRISGAITKPIDNDRFNALIEKFLEEKK